MNGICLVIIFGQLALEAELKQVNKTVQDKELEIRSLKDAAEQLLALRDLVARKDQSIIKYQEKEKNKDREIAELKALLTSAEEVAARSRKDLESMQIQQKKKHDDRGTDKTDKPDRQQHVLRINDSSKTDRKELKQRNDGKQSDVLATENLEKRTNNSVNNDVPTDYNKTSKGPDSKKTGNSSDRKKGPSWEYVPEDEVVAKKDFVNSANNVDGPRAKNPRQFFNL